MSKNNNLLTITLGAGRALIAPHVPPQLALANLEQAVKNNLDGESESKLGFFHTAAPNLATYYPEVTAEDFVPKESDFIFPVFRALSEVIVHASWNPISFKKPGVLKNSMELLEGQTIYTNHEMLIGNELGVVKDVIWQESYSGKLGRVPAGVNSRLMVDGKKAPGIARSIMMDPPAIHSTSVSVTFLWEQSHPKLSRDEFYRKLGTHDEKGEFIHRVASEIIGYSEISFVPHGADPFAKRLGDNGKIIKENEAVRKDMAKNCEKSFFAFSYGTKTIGKEDTILNSFNNNDTGERPEQNQNLRNMNREFLLAIAFSLAVADAETLSDEDLQKQVKGQTKLFLKEVQDLKAENATLKANPGISEEQKAKIALADVYKGKLEQEVTKLGKLAKGDGFDTSKLAEKTATELEALIVSLTADLDKELPLTCGKCSSTELSRQKAKAEGSQGAQESVEHKELTAEEAYQASLNTARLNESKLGKSIFAE